MRRYKVTGALHLTCELIVYAESEEGALERFRELKPRDIEGEFDFHAIDKEPFTAEELDD
jgi:hypothetical protein